ncbi:hypothetical protein [Reyranella sp.]|uniref:hypothetical protein n=1 Tax=Reyranella sp. TaxID=1929291 RepID=UPI0040373E76
MVDEQRNKILAVLAEINESLDKRLKDDGASSLPHVIVAIGPDGHALVHGNVDLPRLKMLAKELTELVDASLSIQKNRYERADAAAASKAPIH